MGWWSKSCQHLFLLVGLDKSSLHSLIQFPPQPSARKGGGHGVTAVDIEPGFIPGCWRWALELPAPCWLLPPTCPAVLKSISWCHPDDVCSVLRPDTEAGEGQLRTGRPLPPLCPFPPWNSLKSSSQHSWGITPGLCITHPLQWAMWGGCGLRAWQPLHLSFFPSKSLYNHLLQLLCSSLWHGLCVCTLEYSCKQLFPSLSSPFLVTATQLKLS